MRVLGAVVGALIVVATATSVARALDIPRGRMGLLQHGTDQFVDTIYTALRRLLRSYEARYRLLSGQTIDAMGALLASWLCLFLIGFGLLLLPFTHDFAAALRES